MGKSRGKWQCGTGVFFRGLWICTLMFLMFFILSPGLWVHGLGYSPGVTLGLEGLVKWKSLSHVRLFATPRTIQSMGFSRPEYWSGQSFPSPGDLPNPGIKPRSPALQADSLPAKTQEKPTEGFDCMERKLECMGPREESPEYQSLIPLTL